MKFFTVCTLPNYHPEDVIRLHKQLCMFYDGTVEMFCYTDRPELIPSPIHSIPITHTICERQWYKIDFFGPMLDYINEPVVVMDLDWTLVDDITSLVDMSMEPDEFIAIDRWWRPEDDKLEINGGMYKFIPSTCRSIYKRFYDDPSFWQSYYKHPDDISPVIGEQNFVFEFASRTHKIRFFPGYATARRMSKQSNEEEILEFYGDRYCKKFNQTFYMDKRARNPLIRMIHG